MLSSFLDSVGLCAQKTPSWAWGTVYVCDLAGITLHFSLPDTRRHSEVHLTHQNSPGNWLVLGGLVTCVSEVTGKRPRSGFFVVPG